MVKKLIVAGALALATVSSVMLAAEPDQTLVVTSSNAAANQLLVYDSTGALVQALPTQGQGGVGGNAGGIATGYGLLAVVNFGSQSVSIFSRGDSGFELRDVLPTLSQPVSVAFGKDHLYVLGATLLESHRLERGSVRPDADGFVALLAADGSAAQVGVTGDQLIATEKSGAVEVVQLRDGAVAGPPTGVALPNDVRDTPFGLVTRGANAYVTIAHSDVIDLIKNGAIVGAAATGSNFPSGPGQQAPCWIALDGPFLYTSNSPSHSISRLVAGGRSLVLDLPVVAQTNGAPIDIAAGSGRLAVVESDGASASHLTQFRIDEDGNLTQIASTPIASAANGVVVVPGK